MGILDQPILETPVAIIDFETTGLTPGSDRVIEASVVRMTPGKTPQLVFDSLINPQRKVSASEIHGITDADVRDAPRFADVADDFMAALSGCVVAAYNVYFDIRFLRYELGQTGINRELPHFCVMYLRPLLNLGNCCKLVDACQQAGVKFKGAHVSSADALATGRLLRKYLGVIQQREISTFRDLANLKHYKFMTSFGHDPFPEVSTQGARCAPRSKSRARPGRAPRPSHLRRP